MFCTSLQLQKNLQVFLRFLTSLSLKYGAILHIAQRIVNQTMITMGSLRKVALVFVAKNIMLLSRENICMLPTLVITTLSQIHSHMSTMILYQISLGNLQIVHMRCLSKKHYGCMLVLLKFIILGF